MRTFNIIVGRTERKEHMFEVEADGPYEAKLKAKDLAANHDYTQHNAVDVRYGTYFLGAKD